MKTVGWPLLLSPLLLSASLGLWKGHLVGGGIKDVSFRVRYLGLPLVGSVTQEGVFTSLWLSFLCENGSAVVLAVLVTLE